MSVQERPIHLPSKTALSMLRERVAAGLGAWSREWVHESVNGTSPHASVAVACAGKDFEREAVFECYSCSNGSVWLRHRPSDRSALGRAVAGTAVLPDGRAADAWIAELVDSAWSARNTELFKALLAAPPTDHFPELVELPARLFEFGAGAVQVCDATLGLFAIVDGSVWETFPPRERKALRRPESVSLERVLQRSMVKIEANVGSVELELAQLSDLRRGDVLRLPARIDRGIAVLCDGKPLARALVGEIRGRLGVQLLAESKSNQ